jgi:hypothetical protein
MKDLKIYTHFYKDYNFKYNNLYFPVTNEPDAVTFPKCESIPKYIKKSNIILGEYDTYIYLAARKNSDYVGVNHYRRYPDFLKYGLDYNGAKILMDEKEETLKYLCSDRQKEMALSILEKYDVIHYNPVNLGISIVEQWNKYHIPEIFEILLDEILKTNFRNYISYFYDPSKSHIFASPFITKWENLKDFIIFYKYLINNLFKRNDFINFLETNGKSERFNNKRVLAFFGERLIPFWCYSANLKEAFVPMVTTEIC